MTSLWSVAAVVILSCTLTSSAAVADVSGDEDLVQEFRDLFSEFLMSSPTKQDRGPSKNIRDTSKVDRRKLAAELKPALKAVEESSSDRPRLTPLYSCSVFDAESRLCANVRQVGTTLTIGVRVEGGDHSGPPVHWYRVLVVRGRGEQEEQFTFVQFNRESLPWNINIGGENNELRISPITEIDFSYNFFLATLDEKKPGKGNVMQQKQKKGHRQLLMFSIEPISIDMGSLYHGEEITINVRSHVELPPASVRYEWARVSGSDFGVSRNLPSNMRLNRDGSALVIKEHRDFGADVTLTCAVFSNRNFTLARRNFFLGKIAKAPVLNARKKFGSTLLRTRRFLDEFYTSRFDRPSKSKRDEASASAFGEDDTVWNEAPSTTAEESGRRADTFSTMEYPGEAGGDGFEREQEFTPSGFFLEDKPKETVLNFYEKQQERLPKEGHSAFKQQEGLEPRKQVQTETLDELIQEANGFLEKDFAASPPVDVRGRVNAYYTTVSIVSEGRPTFEDRESMLIADCDRDFDCGAHAVCYRIEGSKRFCRCKPHYRGNGLFCWLF